MAGAARPGMRGSSPHYLGHAAPFLGADEFLIRRPRL